jgi:hypothetical protein
MMITASFSFEAETLEEGEAIVGTWTVTPGAQFNGIHAHVLLGPASPTRVGPTGNVGTALATAKTRHLAPPAPVAGVPAAVPFVQPKQPKPKEA